MLLTVLFFLAISMTIVLGIAIPILKQVRISKEILNSKASYFLANGKIEDAIYRLKSGKQVASSENGDGNGGTVTTTVANTPTGKQIIATTNVAGTVRKIQADVLLGTGISFHYGIQSGRGGFVMQNSSSVTGNVFSGGTITGTGNTVNCNGSSGKGNCIYGDLVSAGSSGLIYGVHATSSMFAHTIGNSGSNTTVDKDAYYQTVTNTTVSGTSHPSSADQDIVPLPISDAQIANWEIDAAAGGNVTCTNGLYTINSDVTIGPKKIPCDLNITGTAGGITVTVSGPIWVVGNIDTSQKSTIKMSSSLGGQNVAVIADNPSASTTSGIIDISQNVSFQGSGSPGSYVFMISQNRCAENYPSTCSTDALSMNNGASALVAYASHGQITLQQSVSIKEVTAYKIILQNTANVTYDTGLPSVLFESGPAGGYDIVDWFETQ